jgi:hypothetical protein
LFQFADIYLTALLLLTKGSSSPGNYDPAKSTPWKRKKLDLSKEEIRNDNHGKSGIYMWEVLLIFEIDYLLFI